MHLAPLASGGCRLLHHSKKLSPGWALFQWLGACAACSAWQLWGVGLHPQGPTPTITAGTHPPPLHANFLILHPRTPPLPARRREPISPSAAALAAGAAGVDGAEVGPESVPLPSDVVWGPLVFEARRFVELRKKSFWEQFLSTESFGMGVFYTLNVFFLQFYLGGHGGKRWWWCVSSVCWAALSLSLSVCVYQVNDGAPVAPGGAVGRALHTP